MSRYIVTMYDRASGREHSLIVTADSPTRTMDIGESEYPGSDAVSAFLLR